MSGNSRNAFHAGPVSFAAASANTSQPWAKKILAGWSY